MTADLRAAEDAAIARYRVALEEREAAERALGVAKRAENDAGWRLAVAYVDTDRAGPSFRDNKGHLFVPTAWTATKVIARDFGQRWTVRHTWRLSPETGRWRRWSDTDYPMGPDHDIEGWTADTDPVDLWGLCPDEDER